jgi:hypothetical protein
MMIKDSGYILLTKDDLLEHALGRLSKRVQELWPELTYEDMVQVVQENKYKVIETDD